MWRPKDPHRFTGTVVVEWNNVSLQSDTTIEWAWAHPEVMRRGYAYVAVSAQQAGVCGIGLTGEDGQPCSPTSLKGRDPKRYGPLLHPGDGYAYDIFSQAITALRHPRGTAPLGGLRVRHVIAVGQSQSAVALDGYVTSGADGDARVVDAILSDSDGGQAHSSAFRVPFISLSSEESSQPDATTHGPNFRAWMVAGTSHGDRWEYAYTVSPGTEFDGTSGAAVGDYGQADPMPTACAPAGNQFPRRYALDAALVALDRWVTKGRPAPVAPPLEFVLDTRTVARPAAEASLVFAGGATIKRDRWGNALGGLRLPPVDVPIATYSGTDCGLLGSTTPFPKALRRQLYGNKLHYLAAMKKQIGTARARGFLTEGDASDLLQRALSARF